MFIGEYNHIVVCKIGKDRIEGVYVAILFYFGHQNKA
jgi:hypothetical protein